MPVVVHVEERDVNLSLRVLGLSRDVLMDAVRAMAVAKADCTPNDPVTAPNFNAWQMGTRRLRDRLRGEGWDKDDTATFATTLHHEGKIRLVVVNSTEGTGRRLGNPLNTARKGPKSRQAAIENGQGVLNIAGFPAELARKILLATSNTYETWCLCTYAVGDEVRAELSKVASFTARGFISGWHERILFLTDGTLSGMTTVTPTGDTPIDDGLSPAFPIEIRRK